MRYAELVGLDLTRDVVVFSVTYMRSLCIKTIILLISHPKQRHKKKKKKQVPSSYAVIGFSDFLPIGAHKSFRSTEI